MTLKTPTTPLEERDPILFMLAALEGSPAACAVLAEGVILTPTFNTPSALKGAYNDYAMDLYDANGDYFGSYGVCDDYQQILDQCPMLLEEGREFLITLKEVRRDQQPAEGGWRWHKWGTYIGPFDSQQEYLYDEVGIERVFVFQILERVG